MNLALFGSLLDVIPRTADYYLTLHSTLERLERLLQPRQPAPSSGLFSAAFLPSIGGSAPASLASPLALPLWGAPADSPKHETIVAVVLERFEALGKEARLLGFSKTEARIKRTCEYARSLDTDHVEQAGDERLRHEVRIVREALDDDLADRIVFFPDAEKVKKWMMADAFGDEVKKAFPSAASDLSWGRFSYVTENPTACVFYLMRAVEHLMRELAIHLGIRSVSKKKKIPLEYAQWQVVCDVLNAKIDKLRAKTPGPRKAAELTFYSDAANQIEHFNDIWRKDVAHSRTRYNASDAEGIMLRTRDLFKLLARRLSEKS